MICFRTLIFWYLWQHQVAHSRYRRSCDLLSYFDILIFMTTLPVLYSPVIMLWFAFVLWYSDIYDNLTKLSIINNICCDLLSYFDILIFMTTRIGRCVKFYVLWFAFVLWYSDIYDNFFLQKYCIHFVVICFRTLIFWYLWQLLGNWKSEKWCCDLLSYFDILIFMTTCCTCCKANKLLWFAFVLWYSDIYDNYKGVIHIVCIVVICFRTLIFWYLWQRK